jgi:hypothetical protein
VNLSVAFRLAWRYEPAVERRKIDDAPMVALRMKDGLPRLAFHCRRLIAGFYTFGKAVV